MKILNHPYRFLMILPALVLALTACAPPNEEGGGGGVGGGEKAAGKVWDVDVECGDAVDTTAFVGPIRYLVWVKNSADSECTVSVKISGAAQAERIYHPGTNKIYVRVFVPQGQTLQIFCAGNEDDGPCKFDYGVQQI